jgi:hypothetical protein
MAEPGSSHSNPPSRAGTARARGAIFHRPPLRQRRPARRGSYCQTREADPCVDRLRATPARATQHRELHAATEDRGTLGLRALLLLHQRAAVLPGAAPAFAADEKQACRRRRQTEARVRERGTLARSDDCAVAIAVAASGPADRESIRQRDASSAWSRRRRRLQDVRPRLRSQGAPQGTPPRYCSPGKRRSRQIVGARGFRQRPNFAESPWIGR